MKQSLFKCQFFAGFALILVCAHAGVVAECRDLHVAPEILEGRRGPELSRLLSKVRLWVCLRDGEMIGAVPYHEKGVGEYAFEALTNAVLELDCETRRNYGDSKIAAFGRWHGFVNRKVWIVGGGKGDLHGCLRDTCFQTMPVLCEHRLASAQSEARQDSVDISALAKAVVRELGRLGDRSMIVRAGRKKLFRALESDGELAFCDGVFDDRERLLLEYAVLVSGRTSDLELACCWRLSETSGRVLASGIWRGKDDGPDAQQRIFLKRNRSGAQSIVFKFGCFGAEISFDVELIAETPLREDRSGDERI